MMGTMQASERNWAAEIGERARRFRKSKGRRLVDVAQAVGLGTGALSEIENGKREARLGSYERLARSLGVSMASLLGLRVPTVHPSTMPDRAA